MSQKRSSSKVSPPGDEVKKDKTAQRLKEVGLLVLAAVMLFLAISLYTYHGSDPGWSHTSEGTIHNWGGKVGAFLASGVLSFVGFIGFILPVVLLSWFFVWLPKKKEGASHGWGLATLKFIGFLLVFSAGAGLANSALTHWAYVLPQGSGGIVGQLVYDHLQFQIGVVGANLVQLVLFLIGLTLLFGVRWSAMGRGVAYALAAVAAVLATAFGRAGKNAVGYAKERAEKRAQKALEKKERQAENELDDEEGIPPFELTENEYQEPSLVKKNDEPPVSSENKKDNFNIVSVPKSSGVPDVDTLQKKASGKVKGRRISGSIPSVNLLDEPEKSKNKVSKELLEHMASLVEQRLADFGVNAKVVGACPGPIVTRFELQLAPGEKVSKLSGLSKDLARSLSAISVRIVEVIPGKSVVGLEIPNETREIVRLKEVLASKKFKENPSPLLMGLGKNIAGQPEFADLGKMPHVLVAGTTGSGKSVGVNAMILSMLLRAKPDQLRLIMIDPKMLELSIYEGIPHLLTPVVTDMKEASNALRWCVKEMDQRYRLMAALGVRNIAGLNQKLADAEAKGQPIVDPLWQGTEEMGEAPKLDPMPYIVVVVDEFADMMMVVGKKVEELIARLAQKARAAGIHLILATQRPSVDVITGLIKANIPSRIAFQVSSKIDSRTILDQQGAEQLLGYGDMLYLPPGTGVPNRVHGAFVADHEVHNIVAAWKELGEPDYIESILNTESVDGADGEDGDAEKDELYDQAVQVVVQSQRASISAIQRRFKIGYNRAARLVEQMEAAGVVSEIQNNGMRDVLVSNQGGVKQ